MPETPAVTSAIVRSATTLAMAGAAGAAALIAVFGEVDPVTWVTVVCASIGLVPWVLEAKGIRIDPMLFVVSTMVPAAAIVLIDGNPGGLFPALLTVVRVTHRRSSPVVVAVALAATVGMTIGCAVLEPDELQGTIYFMGGIGVAWFAGVLLHRQEALVAELREAAERERAHAAVEERTRIAREVHDVIAHSLTVTMLHVTGARRALTSDPEQAATALERAETVGRESLDSIRQIVGLLRGEAGSPDTSGGLDDAPLPQCSDIAGLVAQYREAGLRIDASIDLDGVMVGAVTSLAVFRLVQEAMTNALRHAPAALVTLRVHADEDRSAVRVVAENPLHPATSRRRQDGRGGLGLTGMAERVRAAGGSIEVGPTPAGTWRIVAEVPLDRTREPL